MTATTQRVTAMAPVWAFLGVLRDLAIGTLLCAGPVTSIIVLGWLTRRMGVTVDRAFGATRARPGWILGPRGSGRITRALGGLGENIRIGLLAAAGLAALTLPVTLPWLGAWWAGWENSFNKGYEQAGVAPLVWLLATLAALPILAHLPLALAHAATERRLGAFFEIRRIRSVAAAAGWRLPALALLSVVLSVPVFGMRAIPVFIEQVVPGFAGMSAEEQAQVAGVMDLLAGGLVFLSMCLLRHWAAAIYARAAPRAAAGRWGALWAGHGAAGVRPRGRGPGRVSAALWLLLACGLWLVLPALIVMGQFMNYDPALWLTHPMFLLPWAG